MSFTTYKKRQTLTISAEATVVIDTGLGRVADIVLCNRLTGDSRLAFSNWNADGTVAVHNPGLVENVSDTAFIFNYSACA